MTHNKDFDDYSVKDLKEIIKYYNLHTTIKGYSKMKKNELVENMLKHITLSTHYNFKDSFYFKTSNCIDEFKSSKIDNLTNKIQIKKTEERKKKQDDLISSVIKEIKTTTTNYNNCSSTSEKKKIKEQFEIKKDRYEYLSGKIYKYTLTGNISKKAL